MERGYWIRSKPLYSTLVWQQQATAHLVLAEDGPGAMAAIKLFQQMQPEQAATVMYLINPLPDGDTAVANEQAKTLGATLQKVVTDDFFVYQHAADLKLALQNYLSQACMGLQVYVAGPEKFMWSVAEIAFEYGINDADIHKELTGTLARSVYCVHCKAVTHDAHTNIKQCDGCGRMLFVRDHFSRRMGAYMGLMVDAEAPGELPPIETIYP